MPDEHQSFSLNIAGRLSTLRFDSDVFLIFSSAFFLVPDKRTDFTQVLARNIWNARVFRWMTGDEQHERLFMRRPRSTTAQFQGASRTGIFV
jgi:hypothetical protein